MRVLIVEDDQHLTESLAFGLGESGYAVDGARTGNEALASLQVVPVDLIVLDVMLPGGVDGFEVARRVRRAGLETPILMLTARDAIEERVRGVGGQNLGLSSRGSRVDVMETSKDWPGDDRSRGVERARSGRMQIQTSAGAIAVVVGGEFREQPDQMALVDDDDVVQAFPAQGPHQSLGDRIRLRRPVRGADAGYADAGQPGVEMPAVSVVSVMD